jgi:hypothetical protein
MTSHPTASTLIAGLVIGGQYDGRAVVRTFAEWVRILGHDARAHVALIATRNGEQDRTFAESRGIVWHLARV